MAPPMPLLDPVTTAILPEGRHCLACVLFAAQHHHLGAEARAPMLPGGNFRS
jgi:hypothetical protein